MIIKLLKEIAENTSKLCEGVSRILTHLGDISEQLEVLDNRVGTIDIAQDSITDKLASIEKLLSPKAKEFYTRPSRKTTVKKATPSTGKEA